MSAALLAAERIGLDDPVTVRHLCIAVLVVLFIVLFARGPR